MQEGRLASALKLSGLAFCGDFRLFHHRPTTFHKRLKLAVETHFLQELLLHISIKDEGYLYHPRVSGSDLNANSRPLIATAFTLPPSPCVLNSLLQDYLQ
jgi:hypothetical protein